MNTIKANEEMFEEHIRNPNILMSEGGADFYMDGDHKK